MLCMRWVVDCGKWVLDGGVVCGGLGWLCVCGVVGGGGSVVGW